MSVTDSQIEAGGTPDESGGIPSEPVVEAASEEPTSSETYTITVDGKEVEVTLDELRNGYSRQADYTRKTQEVAEMRKRLASAEALVDALEQDPERTLKALGEIYEIDAKDKQEWDEMDPQEQRIAKLENAVQQAIAREFGQAIESEFRALEAEFGDIDRQEISQHAMRHGLTVTDAYRVMNFEKLRNEHQRLAEEAKVIDIKRNSNLPTGKVGAQSSATAPAHQGKKLSVRESYQAAVKELAGAS